MKSCPKTQIKPTRGIFKDRPFRENKTPPTFRGLTGGKPETVKSNFDRAVASTVSYYTQESGLRLGLALTDGYNKFIRDKLPQALREAINLWIFLCVSCDEVLVFAPDEELPL